MLLLSSRDLATRNANCHGFSGYVLEEKSVTSDGYAANRLAMGSKPPRCQSFRIQENVITFLRIGERDAFIVCEVEPIILALSTTDSPRHLGNYIGRSFIGALHMA